MCFNLVEIIVNIKSVILLILIIISDVVLSLFPVDFYVHYKFFYLLIVN